MAVALPRNAETAARPVAPVPGSKSRPAPFLRFNPASSASAGSLMEGFPLLVHQPLLSAFPPPTQILPKSRRLLAPAVALSFAVTRILGKALLHVLIAVMERAARSAQ